MSKQIEFFMGSVIEEEPKARAEYLEKLEWLRKQKNIKIRGIKDFKKRYGVN